MNERKFSSKFSKFHRDRDDFRKLSDSHIPESLVTEIEVKQRHVREQRLTPAIGIANKSGGRSVTRPRKSQALPLMTVGLEESKRKRERARGARAFLSAYIYNLEKVGLVQRL